MRILGRFGLKIAMCLIFIKFGTQNKSNMLIMSMLTGIDHLDSKLKICKIWYFEQIEHPRYEYSTWNWLSWPKIIDSGKFGPKIKMCAMFTNFDTQ